MNGNIRRASEEDIEAILKLLLQVNNVHAEARPDLFIPDMRKYTASELSDIIMRDDLPVFVHEATNGIPDAYCFCKIEIYPEGGNIYPHKSLYIDDLCVDSSHRGEGIGRKLYQYVCDYAKSIGCTFITLNVWEGNDAAIKFYRNLGMQIRKTTMEHSL